MAKRTADGLPTGLRVDAVVTSAGLVPSAGNTSRPIEDEIQVQMLGSGQEVGRSCCLIKYRGRTIVCDAGSHPGLPGMSALPYLDEVDWSTVDAILITQYASRWEIRASVSDRSGPSAFMSTTLLPYRTSWKR